MFKSKYLKIAIISSSILLGAGLAYYFYKPSVQTVVSPSIVDFDDARDTQDIVNLFEDNRYWLTTSSETSIVKLLQKRTPSEHMPEYNGTMKIKVLRDEEGFKGFVTYYKQNFYTAQLLFLAVSKQFRGHGYAQKLVEYALDDLKNMGVKKVWLVTRTTNLPAQKVYNKIGLTQTSREDGFVYFEKIFN